MPALKATKSGRPQSAAKLEIKATKERLKAETLKNRAKAVGRPGTLVVGLGCERWGCCRT